jgi:hypothetical protein
MKLLFLNVCFIFRLSFFELIQNGTCILMWEYEKTSFYYIVCDMGFKDKAYRLNLLVVL